MQDEPLRIARALAAELTDRLAQPFTLLLYGSAVLDDYRPGWSDIDILALTDQPLTLAQAGDFVSLRQQLVQRTGDAAFRLMEGVIMSRGGLLSNTPELVVYWGTGGERVIPTGFEEDPFSRKLLREQAIVVAGVDIRERIPEATAMQLREAVTHHLATIRAHAQVTGDGLYSAGWMLDIARCLYTLRTGGVSAKTAAGRWALQQNLCPDPDWLRRAVALREDPAQWHQQGYDRRWLAQLGPYIQRFADVLDGELEHHPG